MEKTQAWIDLSHSSLTEYETAFEAINIETKCSQ